MSRDQPRSIDRRDGDVYVSDPYPTCAWLREHDPVHRDTV